MIALALLLGCAGPTVEAPAPPDRVVHPPPKRAGRTTIEPAERQELARRCGLPPTLPVGAGYDGPLIDGHVHTSLSHDQAPFALALLDEMNAAGIERVLLQPDHSPDKDRDRSFRAALRALEAAWGELAAICPRFAVLVYAFDPDRDDDWAYVQERLDTGHYVGVGEVEFQHSRLPMRHELTSPLVGRVLERLAESGGLLHFQASATPDDPGLPGRLVELARSHPQVPFLWFACPGRGPDWPDNLRCNTIVHERGSPLLPEGSVWGSDVGPGAFASASWGVLPYRSVADAAAGARARLGRLDPDEAARVGRGYLAGMLDRPAAERPARP